MAFLQPFFCFLPVLLSVLSLVLVPVLPSVLLSVFLSAPQPVFIPYYLPALLPAIPASRPCLRRGAAPLRQPGHIRRCARRSIFRGRMGLCVAGRDCFIAQVFLPVPFRAGLRQPDGGIPAGSLTGTCGRCGYLASFLCIPCRFVGPNRWAGYTKGRCNGRVAAALSSYLNRLVTSVNRCRRFRDTFGECFTGKSVGALTGKSVGAPSRNAMHGTSPPPACRCPGRLLAGLAVYRVLLRT